MDFIQQLQIWAKGDIQQGKWMLCLGFLTLIPIYFFLGNNSQPMQKGLVVPLCFMFLMNVGYGGYLIYSRPKYVTETTNQFQINPQLTAQNDFAKVGTDNKNYGITTKLWAILLIFFIIIFFIFDNGCFKGFALGLSIMFFCMFLIDIFLHQRLKLYITSLGEMIR